MREGDFDALLIEVGPFVAASFDDHVAMVLAYAPKAVFEAGRFGLYGVRDGYYAYY